AGNAPAVLAALTNLATRHEASVINLRIVNRQLDFMEILVDLEVRSKGHLATVLAGFRAEKGVLQAERTKG
ncbi:ACT domain-containing protein, partial [Bombella intestini]|uniref:ACT domain-containing protein n=1 Tax=Bombella intestini TaxID=1539051 RepID=UPI0011776948